VKCAAEFSPARQYRSEAPSGPERHLPDRQAFTHIGYEREAHSPTTGLFGSCCLVAVLNLAINSATTRLRSLTSLPRALARSRTPVVFGSPADALRSARSGPPRTPAVRTGSGYGWMRMYQVPWPVTLSLYDDGWPSPGPSGPERHPDRWHLRSGDRDRHRAIPAPRRLGRWRHLRASSLGCPRRRRRAAADADAEIARISGRRQVLARLRVPAWAGGRDFRHPHGSSASQLGAW